MVSDTVAVTADPQQANPDASAPELHRGLFRVRAGKYEFTPCEAPERTYWVIGDTDELLDVYEAATIDGYDGQNIVAALRGQLVTPRPSRGAAQASPYDAQLRVSAVERVRAKSPRDACLPYDYWASGNEPYWSLQVSAAEGVIELSRMGAPTIAAPYVEPVVSEQGRVTSYVAEGTRQRLRVRVIAETCVDAMAGTTYPYRVEVEAGEERLTGCGRQ